MPAVRAARRAGAAGAARCTGACSLRANVGVGENGTDWRIVRSMSRSRRRLVLGDQRHGVAVIARARRAADAVHVVLGHVAAGRS